MLISIILGCLIGAALFGALVCGELSSREARAAGATLRRDRLGPAERAQLQRDCAEQARRVLGEQRCHACGGVQS